MTQPFRFEVAPLGTWTRPVTEDRASSGRFRAPWESALDLLRTEVGHLGGGFVVVQVDAPAGEIRRDGMLRARAKVGFPGVMVSFESKHGPLMYATDQYDAVYRGDPPGWQANVRAIALALRALRAVDRYGVTRSGEQYHGWTAIGAGPADERPMTRDEAIRVLITTSGTDSPPRDPGEVARMFRAAARRHHPDNGGSATVFHRITLARDVLIGATHA